MATPFRSWFSLLWPCVGALLGWGAHRGSVGQYETVWRLSQSRVVAEELELFRRIAESSNPTSAELTNWVSGTTDAQLLILPDNSGTLERRMNQGPSIEWYVEPDGFRRVRAIRSVVPKGSDPYWLVFSRRVPPVDRNLYGWSYWFIPAGVALGIGWAWFSARRVRMRMDFLRALRGLSNPTSGVLSRESMLEMLPRDILEPELHRELIAVVEQFQRTYAEIQNDAEQSQTVLAAMPVGILAFTSDLRLSFANRAGIEMLDLSDTSQSNLRLIELIRHPKVIDVVSEAQLSGQTLDSEIERNEGNTVLRLRAYPLTNDTGSDAKPAILLILTDETRLRKLENARRDFTANVSHELKTPLAAIKAYAETLLMGAMDDPDAKERFVQRINEQASRLDNLIRDLLQLTKIQSLPDRLSVSRLSLQEIVNASVDEHMPIAAKRKVAIDNRVADESFFVLAEYDAMRTILGNLLSNAIRYSKEGGRVEIKATRSQGFIDISVIDNGIGIPESDLERVFERFYRVDKARSTDSGGTGLGLAIVKYLVQALGGTIRVRSNLGEGSEFTVRLNEPFEAT